MADCMAVMEDALRALARGEGVVPLRPVMRIPDGRGLLGLMPAFLTDAEPRGNDGSGDAAGAHRHTPDAHTDGAGGLQPPSRDALGVKVVGIFPGNHGTGRDSHQGVVMLFDGHDGAPLAIVDARSVTAIRTAAVSGVATRVLARDDAGDLALLGAGVQAVTHLEAMRAVRRVRRVRVWSRTPAHARAFAARESVRQGISIDVVDRPRDAVRDADIICTVTASAEPVLEGAWVSAGAHINAVGSSVPRARELDSAAVAMSRLIVDSRESALHEAGDILTPIAEGAITAAHIAAELGEVLQGTAPARTSPQEVTLFKSLGLGAEDVAAARTLYARAYAAGVGTRASLD